MFVVHESKRKVHLKLNDIKTTISMTVDVHKLRIFNIYDVRRINLT